MTSFESMALPEALLHRLQNMQFLTPTPIQEEAIPLALEGHDILGSAQTGTGKTAAFGLPLVTHLMGDHATMAIVLTPTRELATQVFKQLNTFLGRKSKINTALLIGGEPMPKQMQQLRKKPRLIVGTPGRINDHLNRNSLTLQSADFLVLDETDRMLDMGFTPQIESILEEMQPQRQTLLFSATLSKKIEKIAAKYLTNPERISVSSSTEPAQNIEQENKYLKDTEKFPILCEELENREGSVIVFVKTKYNADKMATTLSKKGFEANAIHGDLKQNKRERVLDAFRKQKYRILVATDVAARGLDVPHIEHVINYDLPQSPEDYIHRIGRTARAGATGAALNLIAPADKTKWYAIEHFIDPDSKPAPREAPGKKSNFKRSRSHKKPAFKGKKESGFKSTKSSDFKEKKESSFKSTKSSDFKGKKESGFKSNKSAGFKGKKESGFKSKRKPAPFRRKSA